MTSILNRSKTVILISTLVVLLLLSSCSSIKYIDSWKNSETLPFQPTKLLVVGMTNNLTGRAIFEEKLTAALTEHKIKSVKSMDVIDASFSHTQKDETEVNKMVTNLSKDGYDAIMVTAVIGSDEKELYNPDSYTVRNQWSRFGRYYYRYQNVYYTPGYYTKYTVYQIETSIYNINEDDDRSLVWVGSFKITDPQTITKTVNNYVSAIIKQLKREKLLQ
ncbi:hypothetical protein MWU59_08940 [Flavobacteriaceae bacterium F08102]|nr:hypothetical protein [Flavobacteriaceae bacterium F08102]